MRLSARIAVVSGGAGGIGLACGKLFASEGAQVVCLDREPAVAPHGVTALCCDVSSSEQVLAAAAEIRLQVGDPDILIHCAAVTAFCDTLATSESDFRSIMAVNVWGAINLAQAFVPAMRDRHRGAIVHVASITGLVGAPGLSAYAASKGALITLTRTMAMELAESGIRVNCVCPASVMTAMLDASFARQPDPEQARRRNIAKHPLGRLGRPEDVAQLALFLASDEASWITGATYTIDGGAILARGHA